MQFHLSNLVDLALGSPHHLNCENFNLLHTLLHLIVRKLNLADVNVELGKENEENISYLMKELPTEPSICFKEYHLKSDGVKIRKKSCRSLGPRKSLTFINKKWPKCNPHSAYSKRDSYPQSKDDSTNISESNKVEMSKFDTAICNVVNRVSQIEEAISKISSQYQELTSKDADKKQQQGERLGKCEFEINIQSKEIESDSESADENLENTWLKTKVLELTDSLKKHSNCLKKLKCEEFPKMKSQQNDLMDGFCKNLLSTVEKEKCEISKTLCDFKKQVECFGQQLSGVNERIKKLETNFEDYKKKNDDEIAAFKLMIVEKRDETIINTENLQKSPSEGSLNFCPNEKELHKIIEKILSSSSLFTANNDHCSSNDSCSYTESLKEVQKKVLSHSTCIHQMARDLSLKVDRCEFEICCRELNDLIDAVMQLKRDYNNPQVAAGCAVPLMKNVNCISCQASTNMTITANTLPKLPSLKYGYGRINSECSQNCQQIGCDESQSANKCKMGRRRVGGSHTKISRRANITRMKYKRLNTPFKCSTPIVIYKNRCRKNCTYY